MFYNILTEQLNSKHMWLYPFFLTDAYEDGAYLLTSFTAKQVGNAS